MNLLNRFRRAVHGSPVAAPVAEDAEVLEPVPAEAGAEPANPYWRTDVDLAARAAAAAGPLERLFYTHAGRPIFKWAHFLPLYDRALAPYAGRAVTLVEIGLAEGGSLELWRAFLGPEARLVGADIEERCREYAAPGTEVLIGDQGDPGFLAELAQHVGAADIVIDDGSHVCSHQIATFEALFPRLNDGGLYVCEDLHTSYWAEWGGGLGREDTFIAYAKRMLDRFHAPYYSGAPIPEGDPAADIAWMSLADSIAFFHKGPRHDPHFVMVGG